MGVSNISNVIRKQGIQGLIRYCAKAASFLYARHTGKEYIKCPVWDGEYELFVNPKDDGISRALAIHGKREMQLREILNEEIKEGMCILELGANIGYYAIWEALKIGEKGKIYALEPSPENFDMLRKNVELNNVDNIVELFNMGGGDKIGDAEFFLADFSNLHTFMPENIRGEKKFGEMLSGKTIKIPMTTVSEFCKTKRYPDLIRMDVEGFEVEVINGAMELMHNDSSFRPVIVFETHFNKYDDEKHSIRKVLRQLFDLGYKMTTASSSTERKQPPIRELGYNPVKIIDTSEIEIQGIYKDIKNNDTEKLICELGGVRDVVLRND